MTPQQPSYVVKLWVLKDIRNAVGTSPSPYNLTQSDPPPLSGTRPTRWDVETLDAVGINILQKVKQDVRLKHIKTSGNLKKRSRSSRIRNCLPRRDMHQSRITFYTWETPQSIVETTRRDFCSPKAKKLRSNRRRMVVSWSEAWLIVSSDVITTFRGMRGGNTSNEIIKRRRPVVAEIMVQLITVKWLWV